MEQILQFFGRVHPLILHLPIGILVLAFAMEWLGKRETYKTLLPAVGFALQTGMWAAILAAISGYVLSLEGGYDEDLLWKHQYLGIATALIAILVFVLHKNKNSKLGKTLYLPSFGILLIIISATGHFGGSLTHGSQFLTAPFSSKEKPGEHSISDIQQAMVFQDLVMPIFKRKCVSCHNPSKTKGKLLMSSVAGIQAGGETGPFFQAKNLVNSLFLQRIHLPLEAEEHMPPKGKVQLNVDEIALLEWWVKTGGHFDKKVNELPQTEEELILLKKYEHSNNGVFDLQIPAADEHDIAALRKTGVQVNQVSEQQPLLLVSLRGKKDLNEASFINLKKINQQIIELDLSQSNLNNDLLTHLKDFPHLTKLWLQKTSIDASNLAILKDLEYLEKLNIYNTAVDDKITPVLEQLKALKHLWLWDTNVSIAAITQLQKNRPTLIIERGVDRSIFGKGKLKSPLIVVDKTLFEDSVQVNFDYNFRGADLFYTLDGALPDSTANKYNAPFYVDQTSTIQVIALKKGWTSSPIASQSVVRVHYRPKAVRLNKKPAEQYQANGAPSLINLKKGSTDFAAGEWLGYQKSHVEVMLDMGEAKPISSVSVSALEATTSYIFFPKGIEVSLSEDGKKYQMVSKRDIPTTAAPAPALTNIFIQQFPTKTARFVKVKIRSNLVNPNWHPAPGASCWVFIDEIIVE